MIKLWNGILKIFLKYRKDNNYDGLIATYENNEPKDDFLICDEDKNVVQLAPKRLVSNIATIGPYYWKRTDIFLDGANSMIKNGIKFNNEFYIGPIFNENIAAGHKIGYYNTGVGQVGNPIDFESYRSRINQS